MSFELSSLIQARQGENFRLHSEYLNPQLVKVLKTLGFDRFYVKGEGCYLYDRNGERYLDFLAGFGVYGLGRGHPVVKKALHDALDMDLPNLVQLDAALLPGLLAEALVARTHDGIQRCFFSNSGAEAIEAAIKFSRYATKRPRVLYADHAFHGLSLGALSLNGGKEFPRRLWRVVARVSPRRVRRDRRPPARARETRRCGPCVGGHPGKGREPSFG